MERKKVIIYSALTVTTAVALFFLFKSGHLKKELELTKTKQAGLEKEAIGFHNLLAIDSTLLGGNYNEALRAYNAMLANTNDNDSIGTRLRIAIAQKLIQFRASAAAQKMTAEQELDSAQAGNEATPEEIRRYDAVSFELEKAKVQLVQMKRQLQERSFGEYLTFKSQKGNQMHYVGGVKNNKANGFGVALLDTGSRYEGDWKDNERHGEGAFFWADGEYYVGSYANDQRNGQGTYYWPNGEKYIGQWAADRRNGEGVFYGSDGEEVTRGTWKNDKLVEKEKKEKK